MAKSRPFAYNPGSQIPGTQKFGNLTVGSHDLTPDQSGVQWWNGPDEDLGYVIAQTNVDGFGNPLQPTQIPNVYGSVGFFRTDGKNTTAFINLTNAVSGQNFTTATQCKTWLESNNRWTSWDDFATEAIVAFKTRVLSSSGNFEAETNLETQLNTLGSTLFDSASLVITPNGVKTSKLYSIKPNDGTGDLTVVRNTSATRIDENGNIVNVLANVARIDYSNGSPAILVEPQRTNLVYPSDIATTQVRAVTAQVYTLSFYGIGTVTLSGAFSGSLVGTGTNKRVSLTFTPTAGNLTLTVNGSVANWQLEAGSNATSYIPTVSGSVTRNTDIISKSGISNLIGQTEGTLYWEGFLNLENYQSFLLNVSGGSGVKAMLYFVKYANNLIYLFYSDNNVGHIGLAGGFSIKNSGYYKIAARYKSGDNAMAINGELRTNSTSYDFQGNSLILCSIGTRGTFQENVFSNFYTNCAIVMKNTLNNQQLQQLTKL